MATQNSINTGKPIEVSNGGTGAATMTTAYAPVCAGTTATGALQVASTGLGTSGFVLTSNGSAALPSFQAAAGGITTLAGDSGSATGSTVTITGSTSGAVFTGSGSTITESFNYLALPTTTSTNGQVKINGSAVLHSMGGATNIFLGNSAGNLSVTGTGDTFIGNLCGTALTSGTNSVGVGYRCLQSTTADASNTAVGAFSLNSTNGGANNVAVGYNSGSSTTTGNYNVSIGANSGGTLTTGDSSNININNNGIAGNSNVMRIGAGTGTGAQQLNITIISGIFGITTAVSGVPAVIDANGQLGTVVSSIRYKEKIEDIGDLSSAILKLRPVSFHLKHRPEWGVQTGLIAEEVDEIMPNLVVRNLEKEVESVKYHDLPVLLLSELQKAIKRIEVLEAKLSNQ